MILHTKKWTKTCLGAAYNMQKYVFVKRTLLPQNLLLGEGTFTKSNVHQRLGGGGERGKRLTCSLLFSPLSLFKWEMLGKRQ